MKDNEALVYHSEPRPGKIEVVPTKPVTSQFDLSLAYSPGVAEPCREIAARPDDAYRYTAKGNLVAVVTNGTAVLGLGNIGAAASKPVMEGKAVLFKKFAGIDVFDLEIDCADPDELVRIIASLQHTFGGINLEDIKAPECFAVERQLRELCGIPVMHDDQHGTAIISGAALINALDIVGKEIERIKLVVCGAGAAAIACARFYSLLGVAYDNIVMVDKDGVIRAGSVDADDTRAEFATARDIHTLTDAVAGADVFLGLSAAGVLNADHVRSMARDPIVFALANPDPEIAYETAVAARPDVIVATGRSDHPNQVNNVLGFPFIFRGALDVGAREVNEAMKIAAAHALALLAREPVPETVHRAYGGSQIQFGREYLIPKPLDPRLLTTVAPAVARAAIESGVARYTIENWPQYEAELLDRVGIGQKLVTGIINRARENPLRVVFAEADDYTVLKAADVVAEQGIATPVLLGNEAEIKAMISRHNLSALAGFDVIDPEAEGDRIARYADLVYSLRQRKGFTRSDALRSMRDRTYFGAAMVECGEADALISGRTREYPKVIRPALHVIGKADDVHRVAGMYIVNTTRGVFFFADTTVNVSPSAEELADIIGLTARTVRFFRIEPVVAMLSYSNYGSVRTESSDRSRRAVEIARARYPDVTIDGELQANVALNSSILTENYPFSDLIAKRVNTLIFPDLAAGNIAYKLMGELGGAELTGPILMGMRKPVHILQLGSSVREIVNMTALAVVEAIERNGIRRI